MKKSLLLIGFSMAAVVPTFAQGFINFSWFGSGNPTAGVQIGPASNPSSQLQGWYVAGDYSVEAYMAAGAGAPEGSLVPIASTKTVFIGGATTTAAGSPGVDGSGLIQGPVADTGLPIGTDTIQVRAWYDPNHNTTYNQAVAVGVNTGVSALYNITSTGQTDPTVPSLDTIGFAAFTIPQVPEPSTFAVAGLGAAVFVIFRRRKGAPNR